MKKLAVFLFASALIAACFLTGCEDDDGPSGTATVAGNVRAFYSPNEITASANVKAAKSGITIELRLLDNSYSAMETSGADGTFTFVNVPAGDFELLLTGGGTTGRLTFTVAEGATVVLVDVVVKEDGTTREGAVVKSDGETETETETEPEPAPARAAPAPVASVPPAFSLAHPYGYDVSAALYGLLILTQTTNGLLAGELWSGGGIYTVSGSIYGATVNLNFTPPAATVTGPVYKTLTATVSGISYDFPQTSPDDLPIAVTMSGTWTGTQGETGTWQAYEYH